MSTDDDELWTLSDLTWKEVIVICVVAICLTVFLSIAVVVG